MPEGQDRIDIASLSDEEIHGIQSEVLRVLAERVRAGGPAGMLYDKHGSGHSKNGSALLTPGVETLNPAVVVARTPGT